MVEAINKAAELAKSAWGLVMFAAAIAGGIVFVYDQLREANEKLDSIDTLSVTLDKVTETVEKFGYRLNTYENRKTLDLTAPAVFPGFEHLATDTEAGGITSVSWRPVKRERDDCRAAKLDAFTVDREGTTYPADPLLKAPVELAVGEHDLTYGVRIAPEMEAGRAYIFVQLVYDCHENFVTVVSPRLPFNVLPSQAD